MTDVDIWYRVTVKAKSEIGIKDEYSFIFDHYPAAYEILDVAAVKVKHMDDIFLQSIVVDKVVPDVQGKGTNLVSLKG